MNPPASITLFLCGDVVTARGIDQVLPHPGNPVLYESYVTDARDYVRLAESINGPIPKPVEPTYIWGDALEELDRMGADVRIINLETSITASEYYWRDKPVLYRMHPANIGCITAARIDCCCLGNNHVLDWGYPGLAETLATLQKAGVAVTGAGENEGAAAAPAILTVEGKGRVLVFSYGSPTAGVPREWAAAADRPGVNYLPDLSAETARRIAHHMAGFKRPNGVIVASIHWGSNWGYDVSAQQIKFAHHLVDEGVSIVHGHSSHHVRPFEVYKGRLILYGCGDLITDYEGISGNEIYRGDLAVLVGVTVDVETGGLVSARLAPMHLRQFRLHRASPADARWLCDLLNRLGESFQTRVRAEADGAMTVQWG